MSGASPDTVVSSLIATAQAISSLVKRTVRADEASGLTPAQFRALSILAAHEGTSLTDLAAGYGTTAPATSSLVDGLVRRGLVSRAQDPADRRRVVLQLTTEGEEVLRSTREAVRAVLRDLVDTLDVAEQATVADAMDSLRRALQRSDALEVLP